MVKDAKAAVVPLIVSVLLLTHAGLVSRYVAMWLDETYTYYAVAHSSFGEFARSYGTGVNAVPPLYPFAVWALSKLIAPSETMLRLLSSLGCCAAILITWSTLRRHAALHSAAVPALALFLTSDLFLFHNAEARFYGPYLALVAWITYEYDRLCTDVPSLKRLALNSLANALAVSCTYVAGLYSLAALVSLLLRDRAVGITRPRVYLSYLLGWVPLLPCVPQMLSQRKDTAWLAIPRPSVVFHPFEPKVNVYFPLLVLAGLTALSLVARAGSKEGSHPVAGQSVLSARHLHLAILPFTFLAVPYVLLLLSWAGLPLLVDRYSLPSLIGMAWLGALVYAALCGGPVAETSSTGMAGRSSLPLLSRLLYVSLLVSALAYPLKHGVVWVRSSNVDLVSDPARALLSKGIAVVTCDPHSYFPRFFYSGEDRNIYFVVRSEESERRWRSFNKRLNPITLDALLSTHSVFGVVSSDPFDGRWVEDELRQSGRYRLETLWTSGDKRLLAVSAR